MKLPKLEFTTVYDDINKGYAYEVFFPETGERRTSFYIWESSTEALRSAKEEYKDVCSKF